MPKLKNCWQAETTRYSCKRAERAASLHRYRACGKTADTAGADDAAVLKELKAQYPEAEKIIVGRGLAWDKAQTTPVSEQSESQKNAEPKTDTYDDIVIVSLELEQPLPAKDYERMQAWLRQRYEGKVVRILQTHKSQTDKPSNE